jgi:hypothetical protein
MQKPNYPKNKWRDFAWYLKSDWGEYVRTLAVTTAVVMATVLAGQPAQNTSSSYFSDWRIILSGCAALYLIGSWSSITKDARRRKYDPTIAIKYTEIFFKDLESERRKATEVLIKFHEDKNKNWEDIPDRCEIDPVLDTFDDIGFLLQGCQMSDWVAYQYFSYWVHLYYQAAEGYVELRRMEDNTMWEHVPDLYDDLMKIQEYKNQRPKQELIWKHDELVKALKDELEMMPKNNKKG